MSKKFDLEKMDDACENLSLIRRGLGFVTDHVKDDQTMAILMRLESSLEDTENMFFKIYKNLRRRNS
jgi:hypothetical protein